ncbi:Proliferating cell nuclear antigen [Termitomyces sp. J132]|nr:hypothetical protein C0989_004232 [Termitomyces sp. Mn162]KAH0581665.1 hypothetical protein H2248_011361 [Termitomyces sp. 'cryptogamus']KNZ81421.1 Proliferating cell nuclear antigen [Termitomyces sp. J132]
MLEAKLSEAGILKKLLDAIKELVNDANFECNEEGITLQAMDNSHVALVSVLLEATGFKRYRCDRPMPLGVNLNSLTKVLKCAKDDDECTIKAADEADVLNLVYEAKSSDRIAEYDMKLMDIDTDTLGIPDTDYDARVTMPSSEFTRIVRDLSLLGESVRIEVSKEGVRFASDGEAANGSVLLRPSDSSAIGKVNQNKLKKPKKEENAEDAEVVDVDADEEEEQASNGKKIKKEKKVKKEATDGDVEMDGDEEFKANSDDEGEEEKEEDEEEGEEGGKKRKKSSSSDKPSKKAKTASPSKRKGKKKAEDSDEEDEEEQGIRIEMNAHVSLTFSLKYLVNFSKSASLSSRVQFMMSNEVPLLVSYDFGQGYIRYYLAPKIGDD